MVLSPSVTVLPPPPKRKYQSFRPSIGLAYEPIPAIANLARRCDIIHDYHTRPLIESFYPDVIFCLLNPR